MCIGNRYGGDDAIGPYVADQLKDKSNDFVVLDCGTVPENFTSVVKQHKPRNLIIIDAVEMGLTPGEIRIVPREKIGTMHISTHGIPLSILITYLEECIENIFLVGIQPKTMSDSLTDSVKASGENLIKLITNKNISSIEKLQ